jgi:plastocyanin
VGGALDGAVDAGGLEDAGAHCDDGVTNGDESDVDCGGHCSPCAVNSACQTAVDCGSGLCQGQRCVAPINVCSAVFSGCRTFLDLRQDPAPTIHFPAGGARYSPDCIQVRFGQTVEFSGGDFSNHPLSQACGPVMGKLSASAGTTLRVTFDDALGVYGFYCRQHGSNSGSGMAGAIEVVR